MDCESIADVQTIPLHRLSKRRRMPGVQFRIARYRDSIHPQVLTKCIDVLETCNARNLAGHTTTGSFIATGSFLGRKATTAAPANASPMSNRKPVWYVPLWS